jgi:Phosphate-selective porin O and P
MKSICSFGSIGSLASLRRALFAAAALGWLGVRPAHAQAPAPPTQSTPAGPSSAPPAAAEEEEFEEVEEEVEVAPAPPTPPAPVEVAKKDEKPALKAVYDKGLSFSTEDGKFEVKLALRTQFRLEVLRPTEDGAEFQSRFLINRSRLQLEGHVYGKDTRYKAELGLHDAGSFSFVKDVYLERKVSSVWLRLGQFKRPYNRQEITSDFASVFNERAITNDFAGGGRSIGLAAHNDFEKSPDGVEWAVAIFNSFSGGSDRPAQTTATTCTTDATTGAVRCTSTTSRPNNVPTDFGPTLVARVGYNLGKIKGYSEGDLEGGPLRLAIGASYKVDLANFTQGTQDSKVDNFSHAAQVDLALKNEGVDLLVGGYLQKLPGIDTLFGALGQASYFVTPKEVQVAARFAFYQANSDRNQLEGRVALNYYLAGNGLKLATDYGFLQLTGEDAAGNSDDPDLQARFMAQMQF